MQISQVNKIELGGITFIQPNWRVPAGVKALTTSRLSGNSQTPFDHFNVADHVGDYLEQVEMNRQQLKNALAFQKDPFWLQQQHTTDIIQFSPNSSVPVADASWTDHINQPLVVMTADCLPLLITNQKGTLVSAVHAGWKGLAEGIVTQAIQKLPEIPKNLMVWIGPAISQRYFEVGQDVLEAFQSKPFAIEAFFKKGQQNKWFADIAGLAEQELRQLGVTTIYQSQLCSYEQQDLFYSYRRDGQTGRMASLIWLTEH